MNAAGFRCIVTIEAERRIPKIGECGPILMTDVALSLREWSVFKGIDETGLFSSMRVVATDTRSG
jgi:hypothetical protein